MNRLTLARFSNLIVKNRYRMQSTNVACVRPAAVPLWSIAVCKRWQLSRRTVQYWQSPLYAFTRFTRDSPKNHLAPDVPLGCSASHCNRWRTLFIVRFVIFVEEDCAGVAL